MTTIQRGVLTSVVAFLVYKIAKFLHSRLTSPIRRLKGPGHILNCDFTGIYAVDSARQQQEWADEYGHTFAFTGISGMRILVTADPLAMTHILSDNALYPRNEGGQYLIRRVLGSRSFLVAEGDEHKRQKRFMTPAFGAPQVRQVTHNFIETAILLRDIWFEQLQEVSSGTVEVDAYKWMAIAALDAIGLAGFGYEFNGLKNHKSPPNEVAVAQRTLVSSGLQFTAIDLVRVVFPALDFVRTNDDRKLEDARGIINRAGKELLAQRTSSTGKEKADLLSTFSRTTIQGESLSDEEVSQQIPTLLFGGHDTTSTTLTWTFFYLATHPHVQSTLRSHLLRIKTDNPTMDELHAIPYLDSVVRETLRLRPSVFVVTRNPSRDDHIPLSTPIKDKNGNILNSVQVEKGLIILLPLHLVNRSKQVWGEDAQEFRPERFDDMPTTASQNPWLWGNVATFSTGPNSCLGYKFALTEIKSLVFTLVCAFEFELAIPVDQVKSGFMQKPFLSSDPKTSQLPLIIRRVEAE